MFCWGRTLRPRYSGRTAQTQGDKCNERCSSDRRLTRAPLVVLSVSGAFFFSAAPRPGFCSCVSLFFFREFQLYERTGKRRHACRRRPDCQAQKPATTTTTTCRACRQANDFNSVPLSRHEPRVLSFRSPSSFVFLSSPRFVLIFPPSSAASVKLNLLRIGLVGEHRIFKLPTSSAATAFLTCFTGSGRMPGVS